MAQDLPPSGGYEPIQYKVYSDHLPTHAFEFNNRSLPPPKRNIPARGFRPSYYLAAMGLIMTYGFYKVGKGIREQKCVPLAPGHSGVVFNARGDTRVFALGLFRRGMLMGMLR